MEKLKAAAIRDWLEKRGGWKRSSNRLVKIFDLGSFRDSIVFVNRVASLADRHGHHPEIDVRFSRVKIVLSTHDVGGITEKDLTLAEQIDFATSSP